MAYQYTQETPQSLTDRRDMVCDAHFVVQKYHLKRLAIRTFTIIGTAAAIYCPVEIQAVGSIAYQ